MTRVNLVYVQDLADQHLFAEWREIKMVPAALRRSLKTRQAADILRDIPRVYTLNEGHVTFFFDKMRFLAERYQLLTDELLARNYHISEHDANEIFFEDIPAVFSQRDWQATPPEIEVNVARIVLRLKEKPNWYKHYGSVMPTGYFEALYQLRLNEPQTA
jgi:deoxyribonuclease (pyrimidine dimer)